MQLSNYLMFIKYFGKLIKMLKTFSRNILSIRLINIFLHLSYIGISIHQKQSK